jgi:hypothetical protein
MAARLTRADVVERRRSYFRNADAEYGECPAKAVHALRAGKAWQPPPKQLAL